MARPRFVPTAEQRRTAKSLSAYGIKHEDIALVFGIRSPKTLRKHLHEELDRGAIEATAQVGQTLFQMATSGEHPAATIFWLKTRAGWREVQIVETRPVEEKRRVTRIVWRPAEPLKKNLPRKGDSNPPAIATSDPRSENESEKPEVEPPEAPDSPSDGGMPEWWKEQFKKP